MPPEHRNVRKERTASRPWLAARSVAQAAWNNLERPRALLAAASRGRLAVRWQCQATQARCARGRVQCLLPLPTLASPQLGAAAGGTSGERVGERGFNTSQSFYSTWKMRSSVEGH
jgi:hypothetical protein